MPIFVALRIPRFACEMGYALSVIVRHRNFSTHRARIGTLSHATLLYGADNLLVRFYMRRFRDSRHMSLFRSPSCQLSTPFGKTTRACVRYLVLPHPLVIRNSQHYRECRTAHAAYSVCLQREIISEIPPWYFLNLASGEISSPFSTIFECALVCAQFFRILSISSVRT